MNIGEVNLTSQWRLMSEVSDGSEYLLQNINSSVEFFVASSAPTEETQGGILSHYQQLMFKKVSGDLYMKAASDHVGHQTVIISKVEG